LRGGGGGGGEKGGGRVGQAGKGKEPLNGSLRLLTLRGKKKKGKGKGEKDGPSLPRIDQGRREKGRIRITPMAFFSLPPT